MAKARLFDDIRELELRARINQLELENQELRERLRRISTRNLAKHLKKQRERLQKAAWAKIAIEGRWWVFSIES
jgi:hypothetical protein